MSHVCLVSTARARGYGPEGPLARRVYYTPYTLYVNYAAMWPIIFRFKHCPVTIQSCRYFFGASVPGKSCVQRVEFPGHCSLGYRLRRSMFANRLTSAAVDPDEWRLFTFAHTRAAKPMVKCATIGRTRLRSKNVFRNDDRQTGLDEMQLLIANLSDCFAAKNEMPKWSRSALTYIHMYICTQDLWVLYNAAAPIW